jgi:hypothetical protein
MRDAKIAQVVCLIVGVFFDGAAFGSAAFRAGWVGREARATQ